MRNATLNASVMALAPKVAAINSSRTRPVMRETRVRAETVEADLKSDTERVYAVNDSELRPAQLVPHQHIIMGFA